MWREAGVFLVSAVLIATNAQAQAPVDPRRFDATVELKAVSGAEGRTTIRDSAGATKPVIITIRNWIIPNRQHIAAFPERGLLVIQVRAGSLTTIIDGQRRDRGVDDFWTVPSGTAMAIETGDDSVILQVVSLREP